MSNKTLIFVAALVILIGLPIYSRATDYGFGGDTTGVDAIQIPDSNVLVCPAMSPAATGPLDSAIIWFNRNYITSIANVLIYKSDSTLLDSTADITVSTAGLTRYKANFVIGAEVTASTAYLIGFHSTSAGADAYLIKIGVKTGAGSPVWRYMSAQGTIPGTFTTSYTAGGYPMMLILYYNSGGGAAAPSQMIVIDGGN